MCAGDFSQEGSHHKNWPPLQDLGAIPMGAGILGVIPAGYWYPFYKVDNKQRYKK